MQILVEKKEVANDAESKEVEKKEEKVFEVEERP